MGVNSSEGGGLAALGVNSLEGEGGSSNECKELGWGEEVTAWVKCSNLSGGASGCRNCIGCTEGWPIIQYMYTIQYINMDFQILFESQILHTTDKTKDV